jgi:hypothetical protein
MRTLGPRDRELRVKQVVRAQRDEAVGLDPPTASQHERHRGLQIVVADQVGHTAKPVERLRVPLQERLLGAVREGHRKRRAGVARAHVKHVDLPPQPAQIDVRLTPVDLGLHARLVHLGHERLDP